MTSTSSILRRGLPWFLLAAVFVFAGIGIGRLLPPAAQGAPTQWRSAADSERKDAARSKLAVADSEGSVTRHVGMPSLAPIVSRVQAGVVGIRTIHNQSSLRPSLRPSAPSSSSLDEGPTSEAVPAPGELMGADLKAVPGSHGVTLGTGFVIHEDGLILTALHVVADPVVIVVRIPGHRQMQAELIGEDPTTDLAVIRLITPPEDLKVLEFGDSESVRQGDWVMTLGNPLNFEHSVGVGIVSHVARHIQQDGFGITNDYLQFTAPSNPGSSGSPVFDMNGEVVGIATRGALSAQGLSFAIPTRVVRHVLRAMERYDGQVRRAYVGIGFADLNRAWPSSLTDSTATSNADASSDGDAASSAEGVGSHEEPEAGVVVNAVAVGEPAYRAGVQEGDIIVAFDEDPVLNAQDLYERITWSDPHSKVRLGVVRDGTRIDSLEVELGEIGESDSSDPTH